MDQQTQICLNCHFFAKYSYLPKNKTEYIHTITKYERELLLKNDFSWQENNLENKKYKLKCYMHIWDEVGVDLNSEILEKDRHEKCFFIPYNEYLGLPKAENIAKHTPNNLEQKKYRIIMTIGLTIAIIVLIIDILASLKL